MTADELAETIGVTTGMLAQWRHQGSGPVFVKHGKFVRYLASDVETWLNDQRHKRTDTKVAS